MDSERSYNLRTNDSVRQMTPTEPRAQARGCSASDIQAQARAVSNPQPPNPKPQTPDPNPQTLNPIDLATLKALLRNVQGGYRGQRRARAIPSGLAALDAALPGGGLTLGTMTEILYDGDGTGATSLAICFARQAAGDRGHVILIDPPGADGHLYPPALVQAGLRLDRTVIVRPASLRDAAWACDQSLRCGGVAAVILHQNARKPFDARTSRRFQLAAEQGGSLGLILHKALQRAGPTFAAVRLRIETTDPPRRIHVLKTREGIPLQPTIIRWPYEADNVSLHTAADAARAATA